MKRIWIYLRFYKKECVLAPLFKMLEAIFELFVPLVIASIIDTGIPSGDNGLIIRSGLLLLGLAVIGLSCSFTAQYFSARAAVGCSSRMRHSLFEHIQSLSFTELDKLGSSTLITRMTSDVNQIQNGVNLVLRLFLRSPFIVFGAMIMAFTIDVKAALIFVAAIPVLAVIVFGVMLVTRPMYKKVQGSLDDITTITRENLTGVRVIRAFNKQEDEVSGFRKSNEKLNLLQRRVGSISGLMNPLTYVVINIAVIILIYTGAVRVNSGTLTQGQVVALYNYMSQILVELIKLANLIVNITKALACANRVDSVFAVQCSMTDGTGVPDGGSCSVEFRNVSFSYAGSGEDSLSGISFKAEAGQTIGIIGGTGSGKTTLVNLIPRFYDASSGEVLIAGRNIREYSLDALRKNVSSVLQNARLFKGTVRDNIRWGKPDATDDEIIEALKASQAYGFISQKEGFLDFMIEQNGRNLSGGQRQRMTIARALVGQPGVLILDDSSSALDFATDAALRHAISTLSSKPTLFIVSQRASSLINADKIIVLDDGKAVGAGTHDELIKSCETYREIYNSQNS